jgi:hypothetical protein
VVVEGSSKSELIGSKILGQGILARDQINMNFWLAEYDAPVVF